MTEDRRAHESESLAVRVSIARQELEVLVGRDQRRVFAVSTSKHGTGQLAGSFRTPLGRHIIRAKIGGGAPLGAVFSGRRRTGEIYSDALRRAFPGRDWILTRIMWLSGTQVGHNRLGNVDTMRRFIYIHGTPDTDELGRPGSIGCVRMSNQDVVELFDLVVPGTVVDIE
jgi:L,D-transpeptidase YbiS